MKNIKKIIFSALIVGLLEFISLSSNAANGGSDSVVFRNKSAGKESPGYTSVLSKLRGKNYNWSGDTTNWKLNFYTDNSGGQNYDYQLYVAVKGVSGSHLRCDIVEKKSDSPFDAIDNNGSTCTGWSKVLKKTSAKYTMSMNIIGIAKSVSSHDIVLEFYYKKIYNHAFKIVSTSSIINNFYTIYPEANIRLTPSAYKLPPNNEVKLGTYIDMYAVYEGYVPKGGSKPNISVACPNALKPYYSGDRTYEYKYIAGCKGTAPSTKQVSSIVWTINGVATKKSIYFNPINWNYSADIYDMSINQKIGVLSSTNSDNFVKLGNDSISGRNKEYKIKNIRIGNSNNNNVPIENVAFYDNASEDNLDNGLFKQLITESIGESASDTVVKENSGSDTTFTVKTGEFAGLRNIELRIEPQTDMGVWGILDANMAVYGNPMLVGVESSNLNSSTTCSDVNEREVNTCTINDALLKDQNISEYIKVNQYLDSPKCPSYLGGKSINGVNIVYSPDISANNVYQAYEISGSGLGKVENISATIYFNIVGGSSIDINLNIYNDEILNDNFNQIGIVHGTNESINKWIPLAEINPKGQNVTLSTPKGIGVKSYGINDGKKIANIVGEFKQSGRFSINLQIPDLLHNGKTNISSTYNIAVVDPKSQIFNSVLSQVKLQKQKVLTVPCIKGAKYLWSIKGKVVSKKCNFKTKLKNRGKKVKLTVLIGDKTFAKVIKIPKFKPTIIFNNMKIVGNRISFTVKISGKYNISGNYIKVNGALKYIQSDKTNISVPIGSVKVVYTGNKYTKRNTKTLKAY